MNNLHVSIIYNDLFKNLANLCCSSFNHQNVIVHFNNTKDINTNKNFGLFSDSWYACLEEKIIFANSVLKKIEENEILCISDCDVYCFDSNHFYSLINQIYHSNLDMLGMCNWYEQYYMRKGCNKDINNERLMINCGFFLLRKNHKTTKFLDRVLLYNFKDFEFGEQDIINEVLLREKHLDLKYDILPPDEYFLGCYLKRINKSKIKLIHTTCTQNIHEKQNQLNETFDILNIKKPDWNHIPLQNKQTIFYTNGVLEDGSIHYHI